MSWNVGGGSVKSDLNKAKKRLREFFDNINNN